MDFVKDAANSQSISTTLGTGDAKTSRSVLTSWGAVEATNSQSVLTGLGAMDTTSSRSVLAGWGQCLDVTAAGHVTAVAGNVTSKACPVALDVARLSSSRGSCSGYRCQSARVAPSYITCSDFILFCLCVFSCCLNPFLLSFVLHLSFDFVDGSWY